MVLHNKAGRRLADLTYPTDDPRLPTVDEGKPPRALPAADQTTSACPCCAPCPWHGGGVSPGRRRDIVQKKLTKPSSQVIESKQKIRAKNSDDPTWEIPVTKKKRSAMTNKQKKNKPHANEAKDNEKASGKATVIEKKNVMEEVKVPKIASSSLKNVVTTRDDASDEESEEEGAMNEDRGLFTLTKKSTLKWDLLDEMMRCLEVGSQRASHTFDNYVFFDQHEEQHWQWREDGSPWRGCDGQVADSTTPLLISGKWQVAIGKWQVGTFSQKALESSLQVVARAFVASAMAVAQPALALVDDRLNTKLGTRLSLGLSNPLLV
ncbi:hypothetical protein L7F22_036645 [Adiantum nelumboides]|nr:hypothetical protein [Adiantum nelumboides]